jgi:hypothetical protein
LLKEYDNKNFGPKPKIHQPFKRDPKIVNDPFKGSLPVKSIVYFSNNRFVNEPHIFYYFNMLSLQNWGEVTDKTIENAAIERYGQINIVAYNKKWPIAGRDVHAAKAYLLDRWSYMSFLN